MGNFEPSGNFVSRTMDSIRRYESEMAAQAGSTDALVFSKPVLAVISAGGILLGIFNVIRMALILISPSLCM